MTTEEGSEPSRRVTDDAGQEIGDTADDGVCQVTLATLERVLAGLQWTLAFWAGKADWFYRGGFSHTISPLDTMVFCAVQLHPTERS